MSVSKDQRHEKNNISFQATSCGLAAWEYLKDSRQGKIFGVTSRGLFLQINPQKILFLSREQFRGPLTINFPGFEAPNMQVGEFADINPCQRISFQTGAVFILKGAQIWDVKEGLPVDTIGAYIERLKKCARLAVVEKQGAGLSSLLGSILGINLPFGVPEQALFFLPILSSVRAEIRAGRYGDLPFVLSSILGRGLGLTPSGDDLILGILLAFKRYPALFGEKDHVSPIYPTIIQQAYARTTTLSANLIECAAQGQADERIISGFDGLASGKISPEECAELFCAWGNSSGVDALVGFSLAVASSLNI